MSKGNTMSNRTAQNLKVHFIYIHFSWETLCSIAISVFIWSYFILYVLMVELIITPVFLGI